MKKVLAVILLVIPIILNAQQKFPENLERYDTTLPLVYVDQLGGGYQQVFDSVGRASIPIAKRARGMMISYYDSGWKTKRFDGPDTTNTEWWDWTNWSDIGLTIESDPIWINDSSGYYTKIWADAKFASVSDIPDSTWHEITVIDNANIDTIRSENNITLVGGDSIKLCNSLGTMMNVSQQSIPGTPPNNRTFMYTQDGWLQIGTGSNSSGNTGGVAIFSGTSGSGSSGNIYILTGSATADTGLIYIGMGSAIGSMYEADISKGSFVRRDTTDGHLFTSQTISVNDIYDYSSLIFDTAYIYGALADTAQDIRVDLNNKFEISDTSNLQQKSDTNTYDATRSWVNSQGFLVEQISMPIDSVNGLTDSLIKLDTGKVSTLGDTIYGNILTTSDIYIDKYINGTGTVLATIDKSTGKVDTLPTSDLSSSAWMLGGNTLTFPQAIESLDTADLRFVTNGIESFRVDGVSGYIGINTPAPESNLHMTTTTGFAYIDKYGSYASPAGFLLRKANGTKSSPTHLNEDDLIGGINVRGYGTSAWSSASRGILTFKAAENWTNSYQGTYLDIYTTTIGGTTTTAKWRFNNDGKFSVNTLTHDSTLTVSGGGSFSGGVRIGTKLTWTGRTNNTVSSTNNISAATGITAAMIANNTVIVIQGNGGPVDITAAPQIANGTIGDYIELWGASDVNTVTIDDGTGFELSGGIPFTLGAGDAIGLRCMNLTGTVGWNEVWRSEK